ncbi:hypothetical protein ACROYT_G015650 [Oculina patagonica]
MMYLSSVETACAIAVARNNYGTHTTLSIMRKSDLNLRQIVADNFDLSVKACFQTKGHGNQSIHWTHQFPEKDRVKTPSLMEESQPQCYPKDLPFSQFLPNKDIQQSFRQECSVMISRMSHFRSSKMWL